MPNDAQLVLLDSGDVKELLEPAKVFDAMRQAFLLHSQREGRVFPIVREQLHTNGVFGIKSGDAPNRDLLGFKAADSAENHDDLASGFDVGRGLYKNDYHSQNISLDRESGFAEEQAAAFPAGTDICDENLRKRGTPG